LGLRLRHDGIRLFQHDHRRGLLEQTEQCMKNIASALQQAGSSLSEVLRVTYVLANGAEFPEGWPVLRK
jgi:enamine deaminase RidA (YjgF/YER057c/UK114 family)